MLACDIVQLEERSRLVATPTPHLKPAQGCFSQLCLLPTYLLQDPGALGKFGLMLSDQTLRGLRDGLERESKQRVDLRWTHGQISQETCPTYKRQDVDGFLWIPGMSVSCVYVCTRYWLFSNSFFPCTERRLSGFNPDVWFSTWSSTWLILKHTCTHGKRKS